MGRVPPWFPAHRLRICLVGLAVLLTGCAVPISYDAAVPQELPEHYAHKVRGDIITVTVPPVVLSAQVQAINWDGQQLAPPLAVWLFFESRGDDVTLDARNVTLRVDDDQPLRALSYLGPSDAWFSPRALAAGCGPRDYRTGMGLTRSSVSRSAVLAADIMQGVYRPTDYPIPITGKSCFLFWYDADTHPGHGFTLSIDGLAVDSQTMDVPSLRFEQGAVIGIAGFP